MSRKKSMQDVVMELFSEPVELGEAKERLALARAVVGQREKAVASKESKPVVRRTKRAVKARVNSGVSIEGAGGTQGQGVRVSPLPS